MQAINLKGTIMATKKPADKKPADKKGGFVPFKKAAPKKK